MTTDYLRFYDMEKYLFEEVNKRFHEAHYIDAFDFFCIVIWKANRAKSKIARRLLARDEFGRHDLNEIVQSLTSSLYEAATPEQKMKILFEKWGFALPMATAILTVLWPEYFTIYDYRVCEQILEFKKIAFQNLGNKSNFVEIWKGYQEFKKAVDESVSANISLRDKDRFLFGRSFAEQLKMDIDGLFLKETGRDEATTDIAK